MDDTNKTSKGDICGHWETPQLTTVLTGGSDVESLGTYYPAANEPEFDTDYIQYELFNSNATTAQEFLTEFFIIETHELAHWAMDEDENDAVGDDHSDMWEDTIIEQVAFPCFLTDQRDIFSADLFD